METTLLSIAIGLGLAAACGFRIFVPLLLISLAGRSEHLELAGSFEWMATTPALIVFGSATLVEIAAYYIPFFDNLLDTLATPSAVIAGILASASQVSDLDPLLGWSVAIIGGGGAAGAIQGLTTVTRQISVPGDRRFRQPIGLDCRSRRFGDDDDPCHRRAVRGRSRRLAATFLRSQKILLPLNGWRSSLKVILSRVC